MLHPSIVADKPQVLYRSDQYFIRESGHTAPVSPGNLASRFGHPFAQAVAAAAGTWVEFDADDRADQKLPDVHPGMPGSYSIGIKLCIRQQTAHALQVELPEGSKLVWLSQKHASIGRKESSVQREPDSTGRVWFDVCRVHMPVWLYRKIQHQF